jgi:F-type H+-transporting ATPase subunit gamma
MVAEQRALTVDWSAAMIAHPDQAAKLANRIVEALYKRLDTERVVRVTLLHAMPDTSAALQIVERQLVPFDFTRFPLPTGAREPLITLAPQALLARLVEEYVFAELCEAVTLSFAAENEARMRAMIAARTNIAKTMNGLLAQSRQLRQEEITNEIVELAGGAAESSGSKRVRLSRTRPQTDTPRSTG